MYIFKIIKNIGNKNYWKACNINTSDKILLYENFYTSSQVNYGVSKVALCIANILELKPYVLLPWKKSELSESMCLNRFDLRKNILRLLIFHSFTLLKVFIETNKGEDILNLNLCKCHIGYYMYDLILRTYSVPTIKTLSFKQRMRVVFECIYFLYFSDIFAKYTIGAVVLGDIVYRYGFIFELCRKYEIDCYGPINLNSFSLKRYSVENQYSNNVIIEEKYEKLSLIDIKNEIDDYFIRRYSGSIVQHDVLNAYREKHVSTYDDFMRRYLLDPDKKTVVVMAHVFCDAPHVNENVLYKDYYDWFYNTIKCLSQNANINLLVKEHPSSYLFKENGIVDSVMQDFNLVDRIITSDESTYSILNNADMVVTCGGTIGLEFSSFGKPVLLAARPPYSEFGFTINSENRVEYENKLCSIDHFIEPLSPELKSIARKVAYIFFVLTANTELKLEIGDDVFLLGRECDNSNLYDSIIKYNSVILEQQNIYKLLSDFIKRRQDLLCN